MELATALLSDFVSIREHLLFINGGAVTRLYRGTLPSTMGVWLALHIELERVEADDPHELRIVVEDADGGRLGESRAGFKSSPGDDSEPGEKVNVPMAVNLTQVPIEMYGPHSVDILIDGTRRRSIGFRVMERPAEARRRGTPLGPPPKPQE